MSKTPATVPGYASAPDAVTIVPADDDSQDTRGVFRPKLGRYVFVETLGQGSMGRVVRAYDPKLRREVALKLLRGGTDEEARARVVREAQAMAMLAHPNLVAVYDVEVEEGQPFIAMELVEGTTLLDWHEHAPGSWRAVVRAYVQAGRGLAAAHAAGIVHRDFKPANVLVGADGRIRVTDFGLARGVFGPPSASAEASPYQTDDSLTENDSVLGTPAYMAPEQHAGGVVDARSDQYAFSIALWEALYGRRPFAGRDLDELALAKTRFQLVEGPSARRVPSFVRRALLKGFAPCPDDRHPSMDALLAAVSYDPSRRRWLVALGASTLVLVSGWWSWQMWQRARAEADCAQQAAAISSTWSDTKRAEVETAFVATELPYATDTLARATPWLDRYADQWSTLREQTCRIEQGLEAGSAHPRTSQCLDERRIVLEGLLDAFGQATRRDVGRAITAAAGLPRLAQCTDEIWLAQQHSDLDSSPQAVRIRQQLTEIESLVAAGRYDAAAPIMEAALQDALAHDHAPLVARTHMLAGVVAQRRGDYDLAQRELEAAFSAAGLAGADLVALEAAEHLAYVVGDIKSKHEAGLAWGRVSAMMVDRLGVAEDPIAASVNNTVGGVHHARGAFDEALAHYERALAISEQELGPDHPEVPKTLTNIATAHLDRADYEQALGYFERSLALYEAVLGPDHPELVTTLNNLGNLQSHRGELDKSLAAFDRARGLLGEGRQLLEASLSFNTGNAYGRAGRRRETLPYYEKAHEIWRKELGNEHPNVGLALVSMGISHVELGDIETAITYQQRALAVLQAAHEGDHPDVALGLNNLASSYLTIGEDARAEPMLNQALEMWTRTRGSGHPDVAMVLVNLAQIARNRGELDTALSLGQRALEIVTKGNADTDASLALPLLSLGLTHFARGELAESLANHERALAIAEHQLGEDSRTTEARLGVADVLLAQGEVDRATTMLEGMRASIRDTPLAPTIVANIDFALARARWAQGDRAGALELARAARDAHEKAGKSSARDLAKVQAELARWQRGASRAPR